jgi:Spy/CpxP family protein refolding chaperone
MALVIGLSGGPDPVARANQTQNQTAARGATPPQAPAASARPDGQRGGQGRGGSFNPSSVGWEWWNDEAIKKEIALDEKKSKQIDDYYDQRQRQLKPFADEFQKELEALNLMTRDRVADDRTYEIQVTKVEAFRSKLLTSRQMMLYRMYKELRPEQYQKLREIFERPRSGRSGQPSK